MRGKGQNKLKLSGNGNECKPLLVGAAATEVLLQMSTLKPRSTYVAVNTFTVYVVAGPAKHQANIARRVKDCHLSQKRGFKCGR